MISYSKLIKILKFISLGCILLVMLTFIINMIEPRIEFSNVAFNRFWAFLTGYLTLVSFLIALLIIRSFNRIVRWVILGVGIPILSLAIFFILMLHAKIEYEPHYDRYIVYKNIHRHSQFVVVQDYIKWKPNQPAVDTTLINDYYLIRKVSPLNSMNVQGTWIKMDETGKVIDTLEIK